MEKNYTAEELEDFVGAIRKASIKIKEINPSYYIVSLNGGLPLFDILSIMDRDVNPDKAIYFPGSSKIKGSAEVLTRCFENFFLEKQYQDHGKKPLASLDEVVGGHSVERTINAYNCASRKVASSNIKGPKKGRKGVEEEARILREQFPLMIYGIREKRKLGIKMNFEYINKVKLGQILEIPTQKIITMDDPDFKTVNFDYPNSSGFTGIGGGYYPKVKEIVLTKAYLDLLHYVARVVGLDPERIEPVRVRVASDCEKYSKKPKHR